MSFFFCSTADALLPVHGLYIHDALSSAPGDARVLPDSRPVQTCDKSLVDGQIEAPEEQHREQSNEEAWKMDGEVWKAWEMAR